MRKIMIRATALLLAAILVLSLIPAAMAAENVNFGIDVKQEKDKIIVTVAEGNDEAFAELAKENKFFALTIPCEFESAYVAYDGKVVDSQLGEDETIRFAVAKSGTYQILPGEAPDDGGDTEKLAYTAYHSLSLKGDIGVNYYMHIDESVQEGGYMQFTTPRGGTVQIPFADADRITVEGKPYYRFTARVAAKEMTDTIVGQYICGNVVSEPKEYSVKQYADIIIANEAGSSSYEAAKPMIQAMLNYGAYTQMNFSYNTQNLACERSDVSHVTAQTLQDFRRTGVQGTELVKLYGTTLLLKTETTMRMHFTVDESVTDFTVTYGGKKLPTYVNGVYKYVNLGNISAKNLDEDITVKVSDGTNTAEVTYNPMNYCYNVLNAEEGTYTAELVDAMRALYLYNQAANDYFAGEEK